MLKSVIKDGIIYGEQDFDIPQHMNSGKYFLDNIAKFNKKTALIDGDSGNSITYGEFSQKVINTAESLKGMGVQKGDVIAICSDNRIEYLITTLAVFCSGAVVTFFNSSYTISSYITQMQHLLFLISFTIKSIPTKGTILCDSEMKHALNISRPKIMFLSSTTYKKHYENIKAQNIVDQFILYDPVPQTQHMTYEQLANNEVKMSSFQPVDFQGQDRLCMILYSSGTTGLPKGVKLSHFNFIVNSQRPLTSPRDLTVLSIAPWSSTMGIVLILAYTFQGKKTVYLSRYNERLYLQTIEKYKVQLPIVAPPLLVMLKKSTIADEYDLSSIEIVYSGGATINIDTIRGLKKRYPHIKYVLQGYGMTEATGAVTDDNEIAPKEGSVGRIYPGNIVKIVNPDTGKIVACGEPGEVQVKGPALFQGYLGIPASSSSNYFSDDGFYKTGDIAYYDEDGYFYIIDRIKELIKYNAWQVAPTELEALLLEHPGVKDAGVTGIPDESAGELPTAFVVKQPNASVTDKELIKFIDEKVASWKKLRGGVFFIDEIPKTPSGKILRRKLKELVTNSRKVLVTSKL